MKKSIKLLALISVILLPNKVNALTGNVSLTCNSNTLTVNSSTTCTLTGYSAEEVTAVGMNLNSSGNINVTNITTSNIWQGDGSDGNIQLYTADNKINNFAIATFTIKATSSPGTGVINVTNIKFSDAEFSDNNISNNSLSITIKNEEAPKQENNNSSNNSNQTKNEVPKTNNNVTTNKEQNKSNDATLKSLTISNITFDFSSSKTEYNLEVPYETDTITIEALPNDTKAKVSIPEALTLKLGANDFKVTVTAEDGSTKTYNLHITKLDRVLSNNSKLKSLNIKGYNINFDKNNYTYNLGNIKKSSLEIKATPEDNKAKIKIYGNNRIGKDDIIEIKVTAEDGSTSNYIIYASNTKNFNLGTVIVSMLFITSLIINILLIVKYKKNKTDKTNIS